MRPIADVEPPLHVNAVGDELVNLGEQRFGIEYNAIADRAPDSRVQDSTGNLVQYEGFVTDLHGMTGIRPALIPHHPIGALGEDVHQLPFSFIAPLRADDNDGADLRIEQFGSIRPAARPRADTRALRGQLCQ